MNMFLCSRARPLATGAAAAVREATKNLRHSPTLNFAGPTSRWISCAGRKDLRPKHCGYTVAWCQTPAIAQPYSRRRTLFSHHAIRDYEQLPDGYQDKIGLPFRNKELSEVEIKRILGAGMKTEAGNYLLRVLHGRRVAGTLDDPIYAVNTRQFTDEHIDKALAYLRKEVPVEEIRNAGLRAEDELAVIEEEMAKKTRAAAEHSPDTDKAVTETEVPDVQDSVYGHSVFDQIRATNRAKQKAIDVAREKERLEREEREGVVSGTLEELDHEGRGRQTRAITNPKIQAYYEAAQSDLTEPPEMSAWARILPSAIVTALVLGVMAAISIVYEEPAQRYRLFPEISTAQATVAVLVGVNVLVYLAWKVPPLWKHLNKYFIVSVATPRPLAMFAAIFSHQSLSHLLANMVPLMVIGPALHSELGGRADFLTLFLACGSFGFVGSVATYTLRGMLGTTTMGGSGATLGLCAAYFWAHRSDGFRFLGLPEGGVHGIVFLAALLGLQLAGIGRALERKIDLASHLAGFAAGVAGVEAIRRRTAMRSRATEGREGRSVIEVMYWLKPALQAQMDKTSATGQAPEKDQTKRLEKK